MNNNNGFIKPFLAFMLALSMLVVAGCDSGSSSNVAGAGSSGAEGDGATEEVDATLAFYIDSVEGVANNNVTRGVLSQNTDPSVDGLLFTFTDKFKDQNAVVGAVSVTALDVSDNEINVDKDSSLVAADNQVKVVLSAKPRAGSDVDVTFCGLKSAGNNTLSDGTEEGASKDIVKFDSFAAGCVTVKLRVPQEDGGTGIAPEFYINSVSGVANNNVNRGVLSVDASVDGLVFGFEGNFKNQNSVLGGITITAGVDDFANALSVDLNKSLVTLDNQVKVVLGNKPAPGTDMDVEFCGLESTQNKVLSDGSSLGASTDKVKFDTFNSGTQCVTVRLKAPEAGTTTASAFYINQVVGVENTYVSRGVLNENIDATIGGLEIKFTNEIDRSDFTAKRTDIIVYSNTNTEVASYTHTNIYVKTDNKTLVIPLNNNLNDNESVDICLPIIKDQNGADLTDGHLEMGDTVKFDKEIGSICGGNLDPAKQFVRVALQAYCAECSQSGNKIADASVVNLSIQTQDGAGNYPLLSRLSGFFADNDKAEASLNRLNAATSDEDDRVIEWVEKLKSAFLVEGITLLGPTASAELVNTQARIGFSYTTSTEATDYKLALYDAQGVRRPIDIIKESSNVTLTGNNSNDVSFKNIADGTEANFILNNIEPGWVLKIRGIAKDSNGNDTKLASNWKDLPLLDKVPPTTVIQQSYGHGEGISILKGEGGQSSNPLDGAVAVPNMNITPFIFASGVQLKDAFNKLYGKRDIVTIENSDGSPNSSFYVNAYDTVGYTEWMQVDQEAVLGVAFTGDIAVTSDAQYKGTKANLSNFQANNNAFIEGESGMKTADLVTFTVDQALHFANDEAKLISFAGSVQDASNVGMDEGTFADYSAQVIVRDKMPPFITSAVLINNKSRRRLTLNFNEVVSIKQGETIELLDGQTVVAASNKGPAFTLVFEDSEIAGNLPLKHLLTTHESDESLRDFPTLPINSHANVVDEQGNRWVDYLPAPEGTCKPDPLPEDQKCLEKAPVFMASLPLFQNIGDITTSDFEQGKTAFSVTYSFNLPVDIVHLSANLAEFNLLRNGQPQPGVTMTLYPSAGASETVTVFVEGIALESGDVFDAPQAFKPASQYELFDPPQCSVDPDVDVICGHGITNAPRVP